MFGRYADAVVRNGAGDLFLIRGQGDAGMAARLSVGDAVGDQVDEETHHHGFVGPHEDFRADVRLQRDPLFFGGKALLLGDDLRQLAQIHQLILELLLSVVRPCQSEELADQNGHFPGLRADHADASPELLRRRPFLGGIFALGQDDGHGSAQLMGHIGGELLFIFKGDLQPLHHLVKGVGEDMHLVLSRTQADALRQILPP